MKAIFLDVDGVLNSTDYYARCGYGSPALDRLAVARLDRVCRETGAQVVVSSSWRGRPQLADWLRERGFAGDIVGETGWRDGDRPTEIEEWLLAHPGVGQFVIFDDEDMGPDLRNHLIRTTQETGLTDEHADRAIAILNERDTTITVTSPDEWMITRGDAVLGRVRFGGEAYVAVLPNGGRSDHDTARGAVARILEAAGTGVRLAGDGGTHRGRVSSR